MKKGKTTLLYIILIPAEIISILIGSYRVGGSLYKDLRAERQADKQLEEGKFAVVEHDFYTGVIVPDLTGKEYNETFKEYEELGGGWLRIEGYDYSEEYPEDVILSQSVEPGEEIGYGRTLYVIVSLGPEPDFSREKYQNSYDDSIDEVDFCQLASDYYCNRYGVRPPMC